MRKPHYPYSERVMREHWQELPPVTLWSITGWISRWHGTEEQATVFSGYFIVEDNASFLTGQLIDPDGISEINGELYETILSFRRIYISSARGLDLEDLPQPTLFRFDKRGEIWVGSDSSVIRGECSINRAIRNAGGIALSDPFASAQKH